MPFNSFTYLLLFPIVALAYATLRHRCSQSISQAWLLLASVLFYGYAKPSNLLVLGASVLFNWGTARLMMATPSEIRRKIILRAGLVGNIGLLCTFKYVNFFFNTIASLHGPEWHFPELAFPLGLSFFTLTQIMYLVDTYQGLNEPNTLFDHATFVSLFPYMISGPLVRSRAIVPQFRKLTMTRGWDDLACRGLYRFSMGLSKKVVLADSFATIADTGFNAIQNFSMAEAWVFAFAYLFQLYFDFSGYSDMAIGSAWILGIDIPENFNAPLRAKSISEFWQRWHMSLTNFITNYLYTPILRAMPKTTLKASVVATLLAMSIAGFWHGASWTYIVWGAMHGAALAVNQVWRKRKMKMPDGLGWALTLFFVVICLVLFRSPDLPSALQMLSRLIPHEHPLGFSALKLLLPASPTVLLRPITVGVIAAFFFKTSTEWAKAFRPSSRMAAATAGFLLISLLYMNSAPAKQFMYFAF
jgi:D-alanyl-lipoteichoic acid acyltransferase DltB (MBOAT superfamily)